MVNSFLYAVYCKPTFTGLFTNFENFLPIIYKIHTTLLLFPHKFIIFNFLWWTWEAKNLLKQKGYLAKFLEHCFPMFLDKIFNPLIKILTAPKLSLSLISTIHWRLVIHGLQIHQQVKKLLSSAFPHIQLHVFWPVCHAFFYSKTASHLAFNPVYKFTRRCCMNIWVFRATLYVTPHFQALI